MRSVHGHMMPNIGLFVVYSSIKLNSVTTTTNRTYRFFRDTFQTVKTGVYRPSDAILPMSPVTSKIFTYIRVIEVL